MQKIISFIERLTGAAGVLSALLLIPLIGATTYEVFSRYVMHKPTVWAFEVGYMVMGSLFMLGAAYTLKEKQHVQVDLLSTLLTTRQQACVTIFFYSLLLPALIWMSYGLWEYAYYAWQKNETTGQSSWNPIVWPYRAVFTASFIMLSLQVLAEILKAIKIVQTPKNSHEVA